MGKKPTKQEIFTIPNILSVVRILLIPVIVILYSVYEDYGAATCVVVLSGMTDIVDGQIARRCNMISDLGKILDPIADKLTQAAVLLCLHLRFPHMLWLFGLMFLKELIMGVTGTLSIKYSGVVHGADWHGKIVTVLLYAMMIVHMVWGNIPEITSQCMVAVCATMMIVSLVLYSTHNIKRIIASRKKEVRG